jgi:hypothetical protein
MRRRAVSSESPSEVFSLGFSFGAGGSSLRRAFSLRRRSISGRSLSSRAARGLGQLLLVDVEVVDELGRLLGVELLVLPRALPLVELR